MELDHFKNLHGELSRTEDLPIGNRDREILKDFLLGLESQTIFADLSEGSRILLMQCCRLIGAISVSEARQVACVDMLNQLAVVLAFMT